MMKGFRVIAMVVGVVGVALSFMPATADDGTVTYHSEIGKLHLQSADESASIPAGVVTSNGDTIEIRGGEIRIGTGEGGREAGGVSDRERRINVQTGKHGRDASANASVHAVAPATATPEDAGDEQTIRSKVDREIETSRREMQEEQRCEKEREAAEPGE